MSPHPALLKPDCLVTLWHWKVAEEPVTMDLSIIKDFNILEEALRQAAALAPRILMGFLVFCAFWIASIVFRKIVLRLRWPIPSDVLRLAERAGEIALIVLGVLTGLGTMGINISALVAGLGLTGRPS
jgi:small-conductance mechanosensitive channel